ncbi:MAG: class I SAM-dependent methyltransferase [Gammaproteobacteria bacterium]
MQLAHDNIDAVHSDAAIYASRLPLDGAVIVELGCGSAVHTRAIAAEGRDRRVIAFEVDRIQHARNVADNALPNVEFRYGGAERIDLADASVDVVMMFKSLHHVPLAALDAALGEVARVLRPGGLLYVSEPIFAGAFNDVIRLFHDEQAVRQAAFDALVRAVDAGTLELVEEVFFLSPVHFDDFADFERRIIHATHTEHRLDARTLGCVRRAFEPHLGPAGAAFLAPMRVDILRRPTR